MKSALTLPVLLCDVGAMICDWSLIWRMQRWTGSVQRPQRSSRLNKTSSSNIFLSEIGQLLLALMLFKFLHVSHSLTLFFGAWFWQILSQNAACD